MIYKGVTGDIHSGGIHLSDGVRLVYRLTHNGQAKISVDVNG